MGFKFKSRFSFGEKAIRAMSRETREKLYRQEKDELFMQIKDLPAADVAEAHKALAEKWRV